MAQKVRSLMQRNNAIGASSVMSHRVADHLRALILSGELTPGSRLRQEEVAVSLGYSRVPVREALRILESEGLVVLKSNSGAWVAKPDRHELEALYQIRERAEPLILAESMKNLSRDAIEQMAALQDRIEQSTDPDLILSLNREFHLLSYSGCKLDTLNVMIERFWNTTQHYRRAFFRSISPARVWVVNTEHRLLLDALLNKDVEYAGLILTAHLRRTRVHLTMHSELLESPAQISGINRASKSSDIIDRARDSNDISLSAVYVSPVLSAPDQWICRF